MKSLCVPLLLLSNCSGVGSFPTPDQSLIGRIDQDMYTTFSLSNKNTNVILINSKGGNVFYASKIAEIISKSDSTVIVKEDCISACSEFILPAAGVINFNNNPIIGFHWGPIMDFEQYKQYFDKVQNCDFKSLRVQEALFQDRGLNSQFWKEVENRLILTKFELVEIENQKCPWKIREFKNHMWLPTSKQLKELWGLKFTGNVCADDFQTCSKRIDLRWKKGTRIVVGDEVYLSKGR